MTFSSPIKFECAHCGKHADIPLTFNLWTEDGPRLDVDDRAFGNELGNSGLVAVGAEAYAYRWGHGTFILCNECFDAYNGLYESNLCAEKEFFGRSPW